MSNRDRAYWAASRLNVAAMVGLVLTFVIALAMTLFGIYLSVESDDAAIGAAFIAFGLVSILPSLIGLFAAQTLARYVQWRTYPDVDE